MHFHFQEKMKIKVSLPSRPAASNSPPDCCIQFFESYHQKKNVEMAFCHLHIFGPSGETRTRGILVPNQAPYQLGHTRKYEIAYIKYMTPKYFSLKWSRSQVIKFADAIVREKCL